MVGAVKGKSSLLPPPPHAYRAAANDATVKFRLFKTESETIGINISKLICVGTHQLGD